LPEVTDLFVYLPTLYFCSLLWSLSLFEERTDKGCHRWFVFGSFPIESGNRSTMLAA